MGADYGGLRADATRFLAALAPDGVLTFQTFKDGKRGTPALSKILHGSYARHAAELAELNERGAGVFVMVNRGDCRGRRSANVRQVRAIFLDLDGAPLDPVERAPVPPAIVCESSRGRHHAYWPVRDLALGAFSQAQRALAEAFGGDTKVCDLPRVMRVPGYWHAKGDRVTSRLLRCDPTSPHCWADLARALGLEGSRGSTKHGGLVLHGDRNNALFRFALGLRGKVNEAEALRRVRRANDERCTPPLADDEVRGIVERALHAPSSGFARLPHSLLDSPQFRGLPDAGKVVVVALARNYNGSNNGRITLTRAEARAWGLSRHRRNKGIEAALEAQAIERTALGRAAAPGQRAAPDRFRLRYEP